MSLPGYKVTYYVELGVVLPTIVDVFLILRIPLVDQPLYFHTKDSLRFMHMTYIFGTCLLIKLLFICQ